MRKTNKNLTKQILTLMLAFIMVFTGMGIGSWGVDTAWADEAMFYELKMENATVIGTANNSKGDSLPLYHVSVDGNIYDTIQINKNSGSIIVSGATKTFPQTAHVADTNGFIGSLP